VALLPSDGDRRLLTLAMTLRGNRPGHRLVAWSLPNEVRTLKNRLRATMLGLRGSGEANRALRYMVEASARGHHIPVRDLPDQGSARAEIIDDLKHIAADALLIAGWSRHSATSSHSSFDEVLRAHPGPLLLVMDCPTTPFSSALFVAVGSNEHVPPALTALCEQVESSYTCWTRNTTDLQGLEQLLSEATGSDLVIVSSQATDAAELEPLLQRLSMAAKTSTVGVLLPEHESREPLIQWIRSATLSAQITVA
jgi:hypothetical protein